MNMLDQLDLRGGIVTFDELDWIKSDLPLEDQNLDEDLLQMNFGEKYTVDVGWYGSDRGGFVIYVVEDCRWDKPKSTKSAKTVDEMLNYLQEAIILGDFLNRSFVPDDRAIALINKLNLLDGKISHNYFFIDMNRPIEDQFDACKDDMLQIDFGSRHLVDLAWSPEQDPKGYFVIRAMQDNYENIYLEKRVRTFPELLVGLQDCINAANKRNQECAYQIKNIE